MLTNVWVRSRVKEGGGGCVRKDGGAGLEGKGEGEGEGYASWVSEDRNDTSLRKNLKVFKNCRS